MQHDPKCEATESSINCHCAQRAYAKDPYPGAEPDGPIGPIVQNLSEAMWLRRLDTEMGD